MATKTKETTGKTETSGNGNRPIKVFKAKGIKVFHDEFAKGMPQSTPQAPPEKWADLLAALEQSHKEFGELVRKTPDEDLNKTVRFFVGRAKDAPHFEQRHPRRGEIWSEQPHALSTDHEQSEIPAGQRHDSRTGAAELVLELMPPHLDRFRF